MNRYSTDGNNVYYTSRQQSSGIRASGWQSPTPNVYKSTSAFVPFIRLVVDCPFGFKKCDYTIDKSQRGRLTIAARRRHRFKSDYLLSKNPNQITYQTFIIPLDADVNQLQSHIERSTNRLIIEIPRLSPRNTYVQSNQSPTVAQEIYDDKKYSQRYVNNNQRVEYRIDCHGYTADQLNVFVQGRDLIVQGKTIRSSSSDPTQPHTSQKFSRKIPLTNAIDSSQVVSYFENGDLIIQAPLKPNICSCSIINTNKFTQQQQQQHYHRRPERSNRRQSPSPIQREHSAESLAHPSYRLSRDFDENRSRRPVIQERHFDNSRSDSLHQPTRRTVTTRTTYRTSAIDNDSD
ncbi:hypothetical protein I4U23_024735 [Adineta vaga]|nr:hypothetical protein I4U23_024735 [Adineta vaga]